MFESLTIQKILGQFSLRGFTWLVVTVLRRPT